MEEEKALVRNMLNKLVELGEEVYWKINNTYTDGIDKTILEIRIYEKGQQSGRIAFQLETGQVINYRYKKLKKKIPIHITDMLLDVIGHELGQSKL
jgi:hypothetical protein